MPPWGGKDSGGERCRKAHREGRLVEALRKIGSHAMSDGDERKDKARQGEPDCDAHQRRTQPPYRRRALHQGVNEFRGSSHGVSLGCRNIFLNDLTAR
jgi:hypothetical protein